MRKLYILLAAIAVIVAVFVVYAPFREAVYSVGNAIGLNLQPIAAGITSTPFWVTYIAPNAFYIIAGSCFALGAAFATVIAKGWINLRFGAFRTKVSTSGNKELAKLPREPLAPESAASSPIQPPTVPEKEAVAT